MDNTMIKNMLDEIEAHKKIIAQEHDKIEGIVDELVGMLDSIESGIDDIDNGLRDIRDGIDSLSKYL